MGPPEGWTSTTLGAVARWGSGGTPKVGDSRYYGGDIPWAVIGDLNDGIVRSTAQRITGLGLAESSAKLVPQGAVLVAMYGSIGKLGIAGVEMATNQAIAFAVPDSAVLDRDYLFHYLLAQRHELGRAGKGATQQNIGQGVLKAWPISFPAIGEQRRIVDLLEDHLSRLDAAEGYLRRVVMKEELARGAVFQAALLGAEGTESGDVETLTTERARRCPPNMKRGRPHATAAANVAVPWEGHWPTVSLEAATDPVRTISYGILKPGPDIESGIPYVRVLNMRRDVLALDDLHRTSPTIAAQYARASLEPDDVLVSIRGTYGRIVLVPDELRGANITQDTARVAVLPQFSPEFISLVLRSPWAQQHLKRIARGVGVKGVNITDLREVPIPLPSLDVQRRLVVHSQELTSDLEAANRAAHAGLRRASSLRRSLLAAAFSGQLTNASAVSEGLDV